MEFPHPEGLCIKSQQADKVVDTKHHAQMHAHSTVESAKETEEGWKNYKI